MRNLAVLGVILIFGSASIEASQQYDDLVKLVKSGASEEVITAYINERDSSYNLTSDEILHLKEYGATPAVIIAAIQHKPRIGTVGQPATAAAPATARPSVVYREPSPWRPRRLVNDYWYERVQKMNQAIQIDMIGLYSGTFTLNYEYLLAHQFGIVVEGSYTPGEDFHGENVSLAYRWHWAKSMNSGFVGFFVNGGRYYGDRTDSLGYDVSGSYALRSITIGPNIGKRWVTPWGFSVVGRIGYGYTWGKFDGATPDQYIINRLILMTGVDAELSLGYAF